MPRTIKLALIGLAATAALSSPSFADRGPNEDERGRIEQMLRAEGFTSWDEIELDDGGWEVDDARAADGREYELTLDRDSLKIVDRDPS